MTAEQRQTSGPDMAQVTVTINGRQFRMACEEGQEAHLKRLAVDLDQRIETLRKKFGEIGDTRLTVMAALTISDELADLNGRLRGLESELTALQDARVAAAEHAKETQAAVTAALNAAAERIESIVKRLNPPRGEQPQSGMTNPELRARARD
jgi:cell division protein ZapA